MAEDGVKYADVKLKALLTAEVEAGRLANFGGPWAVHGSTLRHGQLSVNATRFRGNAADGNDVSTAERLRSEEHTSELQSLLRISYAVFCVKKKKIPTDIPH